MSFFIRCYVVFNNLLSENYYQLKNVIKTTSQSFTSVHVVLKTTSCNSGTILYYIVLLQGGQIHDEGERLFVVEVVAVTFPHNFSTFPHNFYTNTPYRILVFMRLSTNFHSTIILILNYFSTTFTPSFNYFKTIIKLPNFTLFPY